MISQIPSDWIFGLGLITVLVVLAVLPTFIALARGADDLAYIVLLNVLFCATVIGWPIALYFAIRWPRRSPQPSRRSTGELPSPAVAAGRRLRPFKRP
ncbi:superinfection immunity protein [Actinomadura sediminis]|uniref:Superinfection immunity protein n=1 Tax=Actinomadura sediminis TaxID=1038904 RepID=A0ABW3EKU1_9ACTN